MKNLIWRGKEVEKAVRDESVRRLRKAVLTVEGDAKRLCPVKTGRLRNSITHEVDERQLVGRVGSNVEYAVYVEYGTRYMPPRSYLRRSLEENRKNIVNM